MDQSHAATPVYARTNDVLGAEVGGDLVLFSPASWTYFELDKIGGSIWSLLESPRSLPSLVEALMDDFDVERARCLSDAKQFIDALIAQGLVAVVDG